MDIASLSEKCNPQRRFAKMIPRYSTHVLALVFLLSACEKSQTYPRKDTIADPPREEVEVPPALPERITLTDKLGRSLEVKIVGRNSDQIRFIRLSDNKYFRWKIAQLSQADQQIVEKLPMIDGPSDSSKAVDIHLYVENRMKEIIRMNREIELLENDLPGLKENTKMGISPRVKGLEKQIATKREKVTQMEAEIEKFNKQ